MIFSLMAVSFGLDVLASNFDKQICNEDTRIASYKSEVGRVRSSLEAQEICTATLISKDCAISAGHCKKFLGVVEFNTELSRDYDMTRSKEKDTYLVDKSFIKSVSEGPGQDFSVFKLKKNKITNLLPGEAQGYLETSSKKVTEKQALQLFGYGSHMENDSYHLAQKESEGIVVKTTYRANLPFLKSKSYLTHTLDTTGGDSGAAIIDSQTQKIIGIHTQGGCDKSMSNLATMIYKNRDLQKAIKACLKK